MLEKILNNRFITLFILPSSLGLLSALSFQPFNFTLINFIILPIFFFLIVYVKKKSKSIYRKKPYLRNLFLLGLLFGFGFYLSGISWIAYSLTFDPSFKFLIPFAVILIPLFLGFFSGFFILIVGQFLSYNFSSILLFSACEEALRRRFVTPRLLVAVQILHQCAVNATVPCSCRKEDTWSQLKVLSLLLNSAAKYSTCFPVATRALALMCTWLEEILPTICGQRISLNLFRKIQYAMKTSC